MSFADFCAQVGVTFETVAFLNGSFVVIDVSDPIEPIVFASEGFAALTGYSGMEQKGRKCSFLQGPGTNPADVEAVRAIVRARTEGFVKLLNYRPDGSTFVNVLYLAPLMPTGAPHVRLASLFRYMIGCQCDASDVRGRSMSASGLSTQEVSLYLSSKLRVRHVESGVSFLPNAGPVHINGEHFEGLVYFKTYTTPPDPRVARYFAGRRRKFEIQIQGQFKHAVEGEVYLNAYLAKPMELDTASTALVKVIVGCLSQLSRGAVITTLGERVQ